MALYCTNRSSRSSTSHSGKRGTTLFIEPGSPWENGYVESFNGKLRDELLARVQFDTLLEAKVLVERWRREYNTRRPHSSLGYRPPAPEASLVRSLRLRLSKRTRLALGQAQL